VKPLQAELPFGTRIAGVNHAVLNDIAVRKQINDVFEDRGMIVFEDVEPSAQMHLAISNVFGPLKDHPVPQVTRVDQDAMPGVIDMRYNPEHNGLVEVEGKLLG
jgi:taurine dioxygenase